MAATTGIKPGFAANFVSTASPQEGGLAVHADPKSATPTAVLASFKARRHAPTQEARFSHANSRGFFWRLRRVPIPAS
jgi:hypothetical protein